MTESLSVEDLLHEIKYAKESPLRIYLGAAPGVGKTYRMLQDGNALKRRGVDVVVGYVEPHERPDTLSQVGELEVIPPKTYEYKGVSLREMDTDAVIARKPEVVLVDELAHTNAPGTKHVKRYEDIEDILAAGIAVFSTCNIQHLESVHDMVERMTGVEVKERVPDTFFSLAREMIIVDVTPDELRERLEQGKIYPKERIERSLKNFFTRSNISMLRELALRELANDVEQKDKEARHETNTPGTAASGEKVLVAIPATSAAQKLVRYGSRMAGRMNAKWIAAFVEAEDTKPTEQEANTLREAFALARSLGATVVQLRGRSTAETLIHFAKEEGITQFVIGATQRAWWKRLISRSVVGDLLKQVGEVGVSIVPMRKEDSDGDLLPAPPSVLPPHDERLRLSDFLRPQFIVANLRNVETVEQAISVLIDQLIQQAPGLSQYRTEILDMIMRRERLMSTFLDTGIAIPHSAGYEAITDIHAMMALTPQGVMSLGRDEKAYIVLLFLSPAVGRANHLKFLAAIARVFIDKTTTREIANLDSGLAAYEFIAKLESLGRAGGNYHPPSQEQERKNGSADH
ncbi:MAG: PTS sugar transporter subunit IIA [Bacteroidota bacterium]|nr:PTS sugar transporter subunit IIA [Bacteroidota bacterium]MDP4233309.1 PTS sugar transporter subunit IIA [Bacteroidota bacterium]MDP4242071.1 PTS sugar transporter subunit IIA [Bacteroidota bacterium]